MERNIRSIPMEELFKAIRIQLENGGRARLTVTGRSMLPLLRAYRDAVELIPVSGPQKKGTIILYRRESGQFVLHRIIELTENGYICCGDNEAIREPVSQEQLLAVTDKLIRRGKRVALNNLSYRVYTALWVGLFPLRGIYIKIRRWCGRNYRKLRRSFAKKENT
ncbi:MAG: S24/S26 family peptidase [Oscillospiraceae bacterium]|nr:S24/S26 family peptidase [Oscillospiraceae bacterium]